MNTQLPDICTLQDVQKLVDTFYGKVREDALLGPVFDNVIRDRWPEHLEKMYRFWQTVLLSEHTYFGSPFPPHLKLPIGKDHFQQWLSLFSLTLNENFDGEKKEEALWRAGKMAEMFQFKIEHYQQNRNQKPLR